VLKVLHARLKQGHKTIPFPKGKPALPERFRGLPFIDPSKCMDKCGKCVKACPMDAIEISNGDFKVDLGKCLFCPECKNACPNGAINYSKDHRLAVSKKEDLVISGNKLKLAGGMDKKIKSILGRSLKLRQVSAGGCNGCEADVNVLTTVVFDLGRFGVEFVASPRHADGILVTGPIPENMKTAVMKTYNAVPAPKIVIAVGACAIKGGPYRDNPETKKGVDSVLPVDLYVPGCPPHPVTILDGIIRILGKMK
jgi:Ni,Fe-hydrogenase III small subunit/formate hydrogenlyase subunit 6/NADH:ubiquinone oxidoreductase subunit I